MLAAANPYARIDRLHQIKVDEAAEYEDWKSSRLEHHYSIYMADADLADALASLKDGTELGQKIFKAALNGNQEEACKLIKRAMERAADEYADYKVMGEEEIREIAKEEGIALFKARVKGKAIAF